MAGPVRIEAPSDTTGGAPKPSTNPEGKGFEGDAARAKAADANATEKALAAKNEPKPEEEKEAPASQKAERPEWMPEKFWTGDLAESAQKMARSNAELEQKLGGQAKKVDNQESQAKKVDSAPAELDDLFAQAASEYAERGGSLSPQMYDAFAAKGISPGRVNEYIQGREAATQTRVSTLTELAGGDEPLKAAVEWAKENFDAEEIAEFNEAVDGPSMARAKNAVRVLMARFTEDGGMSSLVSGFETVRSGSSSGVQPFNSMSEQLAAQRDPRYFKEPGFAKLVEARIRESIKQGRY